MGKIKLSDIGGIQVGDKNKEKKKTINMLVLRR